MEHSPDLLESYHNKKIMDKNEHSHSFHTTPIGWYPLVDQLGTRFSQLRVIASNPSHQHPCVSPASQTIILAQ